MVIIYSFYLFLFFCIPCYNVLVNKKQVLTEQWKRSFDEMMDIAGRRFFMGLKKLARWNSGNVQAAACGGGDKKIVAACGGGDK